jgi:hypothetical protein
VEADADCNAICARRLEERGGAVASGDRRSRTSVSSLVRILPPGFPASTSNLVRARVTWLGSSPQTSRLLPLTWPRATGIRP